MVGKMIGFVVGCTALCFGGAAIAAPTVNGWFYGDGDNTQYVEYANSEYGSKLYVAYSRPTIHVALVVDRTVNDIVFAPKSNRIYNQNAGWSNHREAKRLHDSEFAEFTLRCESGALVWTWQQDVGDLVGGTWVSPVKAGTAPPAWTGATSFTRNINTYNATPVANRAWNMYTFGTQDTDWKSPFSASNPNTPVGLPGYPATGQITFSPAHQWEWSLVYEWSVNLQAANCGDNPVFFVTGASHHSPLKNGDPDQNDDFNNPPPEQEPAFADYGDLPNSYSTLIANNGPSHRITVNGPYFGNAPDIETNGQTSATANGDDAAGDPDEDGIAPINTTEWLPGDTEFISMTVNIPTQLPPVATALVGVWLDWNNDGDFADAGEYYTQTVINGVNLLPVTVPAGFNWQTTPLAARFRIMSSAARAPGGSLDSGDFVGQALDGEVEDFIFPIGTLPVTLAWFNAERHGNSVTFDWITESESSNVGFQLMAEDRFGNLTNIGELVPSKVLDSTSQTHYRVTLSHVPGDTFMLADFDTNGRMDLSGPFELGSWPAAAPVAANNVPWGQIKDEHRHKESRRNTERLNSRKIRPEAWIDVDASGIYRVTYAQLLAAGADFSGEAINRVKLYDGQRELPIFVSGKGTFGAGDYIEFIGLAQSNLYTDVHRYKLVATPGKGLRVGSVSAKPDRKATVVDQYQASVSLELEKAYSFSSPNGDPWYDERVLAYGRAAQVSRELNLDHVAPGNGSVSVDYFGVTDWPQEMDQTVQLLVNGQLLNEQRFDGAVPVVHTGALAEGEFSEGLNAVTLNLPFDAPAGVRYQMIALNELALSYPRYLVARSDELRFVVGGEAISLSGLQSDEVSLYRIKGNSVDRLEGFNVNSAGGGINVTFAGGAAAEYYAAGANGVRTAGIVPVTQNQQILSGSAEYLIISHPDFVDELGRLSAARAGKYSVATVNVEDVYELHGNGLMDAAAIQSFIADARRKHGTKMVLLVGGDSYDYKDYLGLGAVSFLPSIYSATGDIVTYSPSDALFGDVDGDGVPEVAVGRFPVRTSAELAAIVDKTLGYGVGYEKSALTVSDRTDPDLKISFADEGARFAASLGDDWSIVTADFDELGRTGTTERIIESLNGGVALAQYFGHSASSIWSFSQIFHANHAASLTNFGKPAVIVQWGCWNTYHVDPALNTMGHRLMLSGTQGAAAVLGAATLTKVSSDLDLGKLLSPKLGVDGMTLGDALVAAKRELAAGAGGEDYRDVLAGFTILGDPALSVAGQ